MVLMQYVPQHHSCKELLKLMILFLPEVYYNNSNCKAENQEFCGVL